MADHLKTILTGQFEASLSMLHQCVQYCPPEHWEGKIANQTFRTIAYHTLFFVDYYLAPNEDAFQIRELHEREGDERIDGKSSPGLSRQDTLG